MKVYRGIVKGNIVILEQKPDVQEGDGDVYLARRWRSYDIAKPL